MPTRFIPTLLITAVACVALSGVGSAQPPRFPLPLEPEGSVGEAVWPAFEGWFRNEDGSMTLLLGYFNRNESSVDVPIGPDNSIEPGGPDHGQPTHFGSGRGWGVFSINVPADFGDQKLTWRLTANGQATEVSFWLNPPYFVGAMLNLANGNTPPILTVGPDTLQGPPYGDDDVSVSLSTSVGLELSLNAAVTDSPLTIEPPPRRAGREPPTPLSLSWRKFRGPGDVMFNSDQSEESDAATMKIEFDGLEGGDTTTTATFSEPGEYRLMVTGNDVSGDGGGGDQCCWTTGYVDVTVAP